MSEKILAYERFSQLDGQPYMPIPWRDRKFVERSIAEETDQWIQIIPYVVVTHEEKVLAYTRSGGEKRLAGRLSIGFGGHIDAADNPRREIRLSPRELVEMTIRRELREELALEPNQYDRPIWIGRIYSDATEVSLRHIGLCFLVSVKSPRLSSPDPHVDLVGFLTLEELNSERRIRELETWSVIALRMLVDRADWLFEDR